MKASSEGAELSRDLGLFAVFTTATGTMIGAGIFILPGIAAANAGPSSALAFALAGTIALIATLSAVELATAMPRAGGPYFFVSRAMGPLVGTIVGLGSWLALIFKGSFALVGLGEYVRLFSPAPVVAVAVIAGLLLILINWIGAEESGKLQNVVVIGLIVILAGFSGRGLFAMDGQLLTPFLAHGVEGVVATTGLVFISYLGIVKATAVAEEVKDPGTTLPRGLIASVIFVTILYAVIMLIVTGVLPLSEVADNSTAVADVGTVLLGAIGGALVAFAGILATISTGNAAILSSARFPFAMARDGLMHEKLARSSERFKTPGRAIWLTGLVMVALAVLFDVEGLAKLGGTFGILVFALLNITVILLRYAQPAWYDPDYRAPFAPYLPLIGAVAALSLIPFMGTLSQAGALVFVVLGTGWYFLQQRIGEDVSPGYGLEDQLRRVQQVRSLEEKEESLAVEEVEAKTNVVVEVVSEKPNRSLLELAHAVATAHDAKLDIVVVSEVPYQVPLSAYDHGYDDAWLDKLRGRLGEHGGEIEIHHVLARDRTRAMLERVDEDTAMVLVDWHDPIKVHHLRERHVDEMLRASVPVRVAVFKHRGLRAIDEVTVATEGGPYDRAEVEVAGMLAKNVGAALTFVKVLPADASDQRIEDTEEYLEELTQLVDTPATTKLVQADDVREALVEEGKHTDLLVLGAPSHPDHVHDFFGQTTDVVAANTDSSVLIVKEPEQALPARKRLWSRVLGRS